MNKRGAILVTSLWIVTILSLFALGIGFRTAIELRLTQYGLDSVQCVYLARAGIAETLELISKDRLEAYDSLFERGITMPDDTTVDLGTIFSPGSNKLGEGAFSVYEKGAVDGSGASPKIVYGPTDEESRININLSKLAPGKAGEYRRIIGGLSPLITEDMINAMIDWQDADSEVLPGGAESADYLRERGYGAKNSDLETLEELTLVMGMPRELFEDIKGSLTVYGDGKINVNTASRRVLEAVIDDSTGTYTALVDSIVRYRAGPDGIEGTRDDMVFTDMTSLSSVSEENVDRERLTTLSNYFKFTSKVFRIPAHGEKRKVTKDITCIYEKKSAEEFILLFYCEG